MNIVVFDTETTNLEKPFVYNIGYKIVNTDNGWIDLVKHDFVVEQVWHNDMLFTTAYYANKREIYVQRMRARKCFMEKFGYITQTMVREFKAYDIQFAFAYNSPFDDKVFQYNCDWFKCNNPFDNIEIVDIRGYVHKAIAFTPEYQKFCEDNGYFTESGNYSTTAETVFRYVMQDTDFVEEHTALSDSHIETEILKTCCEFYGLTCGEKYKTYQSIKRNIDKTLTVVLDGKETVFNYKSRRNATDGSKITLKSE